MRFVAYRAAGNDEERGKRREALKKLSDFCAERCQSNVAWRRSLGIEQTWAEDQAYYEGEEQPGTMDGTTGNKPLFVKDSRENKNKDKSDLFLNVCLTYTDTAAGRVMDLVVPGDDRAWSIEPTPIPDLPELADGKPIPTYLDEAIHQDVYEAQGLQGADAEKAVNNSRQKMRDDAQATIKKAKEVAAREQMQIEDWLIESKFANEMRVVIDDVCRLGTGVIKGPVPMLRKALRWRDGELVTEEKVKPGSARVDIWNCFPDPTGLDRHQDGESHWERKDMTGHNLRQLAKEPGYYADVIAQVLQEEPQYMTNTGLKIGSEAGIAAHSAGRLYELWEGYLFISASDMRSIGGQVFRNATEARQEDAEDKDLMKELAEFAAKVIMVNGRIVKISANPLESGAFPYDYMVWAARSGVPWGRGVPRLCRHAQRMVLSASRVMMDNAGVAAGPMLVFNKAAVAPQDNKWKIEAFKIFLADTDLLERLDDAIKVIDIPMQQSEMEAIIYLGLKFFEDVTGQPVMLQGQSGNNTPDTVGGLRILNENATSPMRRVARHLDDRVTEPHISRYHEYLHLHGDGRGGDYTGGDVQIFAQGSAALVKRDIESQNMLQLFGFAENPMFDIDPAKLMSMYIRSLGLDDKLFRFSDDQRKAIMEELSKPKPDSAVQVAEIRAAVDQFKAELQDRQKASDREKEMVIEQWRRQSGDRATQAKERIAELGALMKQDQLDDQARTRMVEINEELNKFMIEQTNELKMFFAKLGADTAKDQRAQETAMATAA